MSKHLTAWMACTGCVMLLLTIFLTGCEKSPVRPLESRQNPVQQPVGPAGGILKVGPMMWVNSYQAFVELRRRKPLNVEALKNHYLSFLRKFVQESDHTLGTKLDEEIVAAFDAIDNGKNMYGQAQVADKLIQYTFFLLAHHYINLMVSSDDRDRLYKKLGTVMPVIGATVERRGSWVGRQEEFVNSFHALQEKVSGAIDQKQRDQLAQAVEQTKAFITKVYVLSVFYELEGLAQTRGQDEDKAAEKIAEAKTYHRFVAEEHSRRDAQGAQAVIDQLDKPVDQVDVDFVREVLRKNFQQELADVDPALLGVKVN